MKGYLGETVLDSLDGTPFERFNKWGWACHYIKTYASIDGEPHKAWMRDQVSRIILGTPVIVSVAKWANGQIEYRFSTGDPSAEYIRRAAKRRADGYTVNVGVVP